MMANIGWKSRIAMVLSFLWIVFTVALSAGEQQNSFSIFAMIGVLPLSIAWGIAWVWWGFRTRKVIPASEADEGNNSTRIITEEDKIDTNNGTPMESKVSEKQSIESQAGFVVRLFRGDISLPITYWVFGALIGNLGFQIIQTLIEYNYFEIMYSTAGTWSVMGFYLLTVGYSTFMLIAIWRSAEKYKGRKIWGNLARVGVIFGIFALIGNLVTGLQQSTDIEFALNEEIKSINKSLPSMIDDETRMDQISIQQKDVYYNYTLLNWLAADMDISRFTIMMTPHLITSACVNENTRPMLDGGRKLVYVYRDKESKPVAKIAIDKSDCM